MTKEVNAVSRRGFLKGLGVAAAGSLIVPSVAKSVFAQDFTQVALYARLSGTEAPFIDVNNLGTTDAWIGLGDQVDLFWVTTPDVSQIDLGDDLGVFASDQGGNENGFNWGVTTVAPTTHASFQIFALDGDFEAASAASVRVIGRASAEGPFAPIDEEVFFARRTSSTTTRTDEQDEWEVTLPSSRFSNRLRITDMKPTGPATSGAPQAWRILKTNEDGVEVRFSLSPTDVYQSPFTTPGTDITVPVAGDWSFVTRGVVPDRDVPFMVKMISIDL